MPCLVNCILALPASIANLVNLEVLNLFNNQLEVCETVAKYSLYEQHGYADIDSTLI